MVREQRKTNYSVQKQNNNNLEKIIGKKQLYEYFKRQTGEMLQQKPWAGVRMGNLKRETKSLLIAAQNNAIKINYI